MSAILSEKDGPAFLALLKRYVVDYTNAHNQAATVDIMEPDYRLRMGDHIIEGRDGGYAAATRKQLDQFPGLCLTVHEIWTSGERLAMRFSEHGASIRHGGNLAAWGGIGLYRWNGSKLTSNMVEQDYFSRAQQLKTGTPNPVEAPAIAPWDTPTSAADPRAEFAVKQWLDGGLLEKTQEVVCDDLWHAAGDQQLLVPGGIEINDLFSCGRAVAFHATQLGTLRQPLGELAPDATPVRVHVAGIVHVEHDRVVRGRVIRNRLSLTREVR